MAESEALDLPEDEEICVQGYPEHDEQVTYQGDDGVQWMCRRCGAEGWTDAEGSEGNA